MLVEIQNDVYFIHSRLKEIDQNYQLFFNTKRDKFEVHNKGQIGGSYCLTVPYSLLDQRTIELVRKTRTENKKKLFEEIDRDNDYLERLQEKRMLEEAKNRMSEIAKYAK